MDIIICPYCNENIPKDSKECEYCCGEISVNNVDLNTSFNEKQTKVCTHCGKEVLKIAKWCNHCGGKLEDYLNNVNTKTPQFDSLDPQINSDPQVDSLDFEVDTTNQENNNFNNHFDEAGEFEKYLLRLQNNIPNLELIELPSFKEVYFYNEVHEFAYVSYIPNINVNIATRYINEASNHTLEKYGFSGRWAPVAVPIIVSENVSEEVINFILKSNKLRRGLIKSVYIMNAVYDLSNNTLYYKKKTSLVDFFRNPDINEFVEKFNV